MLELWGIQSTPSLPSLLGLLWSGMLAPDRALFKQVAFSYLDVPLKTIIFPESNFKQIIFKNFSQFVTNSIFLKVWLKLFPLQSLILTFDNASLGNYMKVNQD